MNQIIQNLTRFPVLTQISLQHHSKKIVVAGMKEIKIKQFRSCRLQYDAGKRKTSHIFLIIILISELNTE